MSFPDNFKARDRMQAGMLATERGVAYYSHRRSLYRVTRGTPSDEDGTPLRFRGTYNFITLEDMADELNHAIALAIRAAVQA